MKHIQVKHTENLLTPRGKQMVVLGKFMTIITGHIMPEIGMIGSNNVHQLFLWTQNHRNQFDQLPEYKNTKAVIPVIISEKERIVANHYAYDVVYNRIVKVVNIKDNFVSITSDFPGLDHSNISNLRRILVMPNQFSDKHLKAIINKRLIDGSNVYVECDNSEDNMDSYVSMFGGEEIGDTIRFDENSHAIIHKVNESPEEIIKNMVRYCEDKQIYDKLGGYGDFYYRGKKWLEQNKH